MFDRVICFGAINIKFDVIFFVSCVQNSILLLKKVLRTHLINADGFFIIFLFKKLSFMYSASNAVMH